MSEQEKQSVVGEPTQAVPPETTQEAPAPIEDAIVEDLKEAEEVQDTEVPQSETPLPAFDPRDLTPEQLQDLKAILSATPERTRRGAGETRVKVRKNNEGLIVVDFQNARLALIENEALQRKEERHVIPVLFEGAKEYQIVQYKEFMAYEQVECKVKNLNKEEVPVVEGETENEHGQLVEMIRKDVKITLDITTPDGRDITIEGKVANA